MGTLWQRGRVWWVPADFCSTRQCFLSLPLTLADRGEAEAQTNTTTRPAELATQQADIISGEMGNLGLVLASKHGMQYPGSAAFPSFQNGMVWLREVLALKIVKVYF